MSRGSVVPIVRSALAVLFVSAIALASPARAAAQAEPDTQDLAVWAQVLATVSLSDNWLLHLEGQPRWVDNVSEMDQVILRSAIGRRVGPRVSLWGGYAFVPRTRGAGTRYEHRAWQQLSATFPAAGLWTPSIRVRLEQRFLDTWGDSSQRLRLMGRAVRPIDADKTWSIAAWNELLLTLDRTDSGPARGVDQNRLFAGIVRKLSDQASLETGYLWQTQDPPGAAPRQNTHVAFVWLNLTL